MKTIIATSIAIVLFGFMLDLDAAPTMVDPTPTPLQAKEKRATEIKEAMAYTCGFAHGLNGKQPLKDCAAVLETARRHGFNK